ncbi:neurotrimin-like isoform X2 [Vespula maculifrons]|uniref:Neurotrimin-like isoform X2 n=1 Tax=Vespula maculifrons TaxID=7453 RepID=A0ABD2BJH1_VESMC
MSTYLIFNQLRIIHPQFRPKSRTSVLEPSQNFLSSNFSDHSIMSSRTKGPNRKKVTMSKFFSEIYSLEYGFLVRTGK